MTDLRRFGGLDLVLLLVVLVAAAVLRVGYLKGGGLSGAGDAPYRMQDDEKAEREALVAALRQGRGFVAANAPLAAGEEPTAHVAVGYPWLISLLDGSWVKLETDDLVRWIQCALGTLTAGLYFLIGRRAFHDRWVGALAGLFCAGYPYWVLNTAELNDGVLTTLLLALCLFLGVRAGQSGGALTSLLFGLGLAGLACVRAATLPFGAVAVLWFLLRCRRLPRGWLYAVLAFLGFVNGLIPWAARNYQTFRAVFPVVDSAYLHLWVGNNPQATGGPMGAAAMDRVLADAHLEDGRTRLEELQSRRQPERYQQLAWDVWDEVRSNPAGTFQRRLRAGLGYLLSTNWLERRPLAEAGENPPQGEAVWFSRSLPVALPGVLFFMLLLGALGWRWSYGWRREAMPISLAVMWLPLPYLLGHAEWLHGPRLPLDGVLLTYAALALVCLVPGLGSPLLQGEDVERAA
jgi:hypothetical protein